MRISGRRSPSTRAFLIASLGLILAAAPGCGAIHGSVILALLPDDSSSSAPAAQTPPTAAVDPIPRAKGAIPIGYRLIDANSDAISARFEYSTNGGASFQDASLASGAPEGTAGLTSAPGGVTHSFLWDVPRDLGSGAFTRVRFRVTPHDGIVTGTAGISPQGIVGNTPPFILIEDVVLRDENNTKIATVVMSVTDSTSDLVTLDVTWEVLASTDPSVGAFPIGRTGSATILAGDVSDVASDPLGLPRSFVWNLVNDFKDVAGANLRLTITPRDALDAGVPSIFEPVFWQRDDRPLAFFLPVPRQAGTVTADYSLVTVDDRTDVSIQVAFQIGDAAANTFPATPTAQQEFAATILSPVSGLSAAPLGFGHILVWDAPADLALHGLGLRQFVRLKMIPTAATETGSPAFSNGFIVGNDPPSVTIDPIASPQTGIVPIAFTLRDSTSDPTTIAVEVRTSAAGSFAPIPAGVLTGALASLSSSPGGRPHVVFWNAIAQLGGQNATGLAVRVTPSDTSTGIAVVSNVFDIEVSTQPIAAITGPLSGVLVDSQDVAYRLFQQLPSNSVAVDVVIREGPSGPTRPATRLALSEGTTGLSATLEGSAHTFSWDVAADFTVGGKGLDRSGIFLVITPRNAGGPGVASTAGPFQINQNSAPALAASAGPETAAAPFRVPFTATLADSEGDAATIQAELRLTSPITSAFVPMSLVDIAGAPIQGPLTSTPGALAFSWDARAQLEALSPTPLSGAALEAMRAEVRFTASDNADQILGIGTPVTLELLLDVTAPPSATAFAFLNGVDPGETVGGVLDYTFTLVDPEGGNATVTLEVDGIAAAEDFVVVDTFTLAASAAGITYSRSFDTVARALGFSGPQPLTFRLRAKDSSGPKKGAGTTDVIPLVIVNTSTVTPPQVQVLTPRSGLMAPDQTFQLRTSQSPAGTATLHAFFQIAGVSTTRAARIIVGGVAHDDGIAPGVPTAESGAAVTVTWTATTGPSSITAGADVSGITLTFRLFDGAGAGNSDVVGPFSLDGNGAPVVTSVLVSNPQGISPFFSTVSATVTDPEDQQTDLRFEVQFTASPGFVAARMVTLTGVPGTLLPERVTVPTGTATLGWDAKADAKARGISGAALATVSGSFRVTPENRAPNPATGTPFTTSFFVDLFAAPSVSVTAGPAPLPATHTGSLTFDLTLASPDGTEVDVTLLAAEVAPGAGAPPPTAFTQRTTQRHPTGSAQIVWASGTQGAAATGGPRDVYVKFRPRDPSALPRGVDSGVHGPIRLDNSGGGGPGPSTEIIEILSVTPAGEGLIAINYRATHPDVVSASVQVHIEAAGRTITAHPAAGSVPSQNPSGADVPMSPAGVLHTFLWDTRFDLPAQSTPVARVLIELLSPEGPTAVFTPVPAVNATSIARMDFVLGQPSPFSASVNPGGLHLSGPGAEMGDVTITSLAVKVVDVASEKFRVIVPDALNHRVLIWKSTSASGGRSPDLVVGQPGFTQHGPNRGRPAPDRSTLSRPVAVATDNFAVGSNRFAVVDAGNFRVAVYDQLPTPSQQATFEASAILGQDAPDSGTPAANIIASPARLQGPSALAFCPVTTTALQSMLLVVDRASRRLMVYDPSKDQSSAVPGAFIGALVGDEGGAPPDAGPDTFVDPIGVAVSHDGSVVYVSDAGAVTETANADPAQNGGVVNLTWRVWVARASELFAAVGVGGPASVTPVFARVKPFTATGPDSRMGTFEQGDILPSTSLFRPGGMFASRDVLYPSLLYVAPLGAGSIVAFDLTEAPGGAVVGIGGAVGGTITIGAEGQVGDPSGGGTTPADEMRPAFRLDGLGGTSGGGAAFARADDGGDEIRAGLVVAVSPGENIVKLRPSPVRIRSAAALRGLLINEIHPFAFDMDTDGDTFMDARAPEWIEIINTAPAAIDLADVRLSALDTGDLATSTILSITGTPFPLRQGERVVVVADEDGGALPFPAGYFPPETPVLKVRTVTSGALVSDFMPDGGGAVVLFTGKYTGNLATGGGGAGFVALEYLAYPAQTIDDPQPPGPTGFGGFWIQDQFYPLSVEGEIANFGSARDADHDATFLRTSDGRSGVSAQVDFRFQFFNPDGAGLGFSDPNSAGRPNSSPSFPSPACPTHTVVDLADGYSGHLGSPIRAPNDIPASDDTLLMPAGVATPSSPPDSPGSVQLAIADRGHNRVVVYVSDTAPSEDAAPASIVLGQPDFSATDPEPLSRLSRPEGVAIDPFPPTGSAVIYIADTGHARIVRCSDPAGVLTDGMALESSATFLRAGGGPDPDPFEEPCDVQVLGEEGALERRLFTLERGLPGGATTGRLRIYRETDSEGTFFWDREKTITATALAPLAFPSAVFATETRLFLADTGNDRVLVLDLAQVLTATAAPPVLAVLGGAGAPPDQRLRRPAGLFATGGLAFNDPGERLQLLVADTGGNRVVIYRHDETGSFETTFDEVVGQLTSGGRRPNATAVPDQERVSDAGLYLSPRPGLPDAPHIGIGGTLRTRSALEGGGEIRLYLCDPGNDRVGVLGNASFPGEASRGTIP